MPWKHWMSAWLAAGTLVGCAATTGTGDESSSSSSGSASPSSSVAASSAAASSMAASSGASSAAATSSGGSTSSAAASSSGGGASSSVASSSSSAASTASPASSSSSAAASSGSGGVADPAVAGPFAIAEQNVSRYAVAATSSNVNLFVVGPTAAGAPVPVVLMAPGFALSIDQFKETARYVARHGFVVLLTSYNINVFAPDHAKAAQEMRGALDFLSTDATWSARADLQNIGTSGHSLGGKLAVLVAAQDTRVKASMTMDPVDGTQMPDASSMLPLAMPMGFLGETTDATSTGMACAPAAQNYTTFYDAASAPALEVTVLGANHMSFLDDVASCGITCAFCNDATATNADVLSLSRAYLVAFFQRYLRGNTAYDAYLVGSEAQARYVATSRATLRSR